MSAFRLALVRQRYTPYGGAERFVARAMAALGSEDTQVSIVTRQWDTQSGPALICNPFYLGRVWRDWGFARCVCRTLASENFDLVQSHERIACCDIYRAGDGVHREWLAQRARTLGPWGRLGQKLNPYHRYTLAAEERLFHSPQLQAVICNSNMVKAEIMRYFGLAEEKLHVIYSGVDLEAFHPQLRQIHRELICHQLGIPPIAKVFLFVGSGFERKGLAAALHALPDAAFLLVVGRDKRAHRYQALARQLGIANRVYFLGPQHDVKPYYGVADALVLPTLYDPFPNVALEALATGLPVITSTKSGAAELLQNTGLIVDALDENGLMKAMTTMFDPNRSAALREQARNLAMNYSMQGMSARLLSLYRELKPVAGL